MDLLKLLLLGGAAAQIAAQSADNEFNAEALRACLDPYYACLGITLPDDIYYYGDDGGDASGDASSYYYWLDASQIQTTCAQWEPAVADNCEAGQDIGLCLDEWAAYVECNWKIVLSQFGLDCDLSCDDAAQTDNDLRTPDDDFFHDYVNVFEASDDDATPTDDDDDFFAPLFNDDNEESDRASTPKQAIAAIIAVAVAAAAAI